MKIGDKCYYCSEIGMTEEHVPPKCIYPEMKDIGENYRENLMWVPSCELHNNMKSKDDEYLLLCLVLSDFTNKIGDLLGRTKITRIIKKFPGKIRKHMIAPRFVPIMQGGELKNRLSYEYDINRLSEVFKKITAALYLLHYKEYYDTSLKIIVNHIDMQKFENGQKILINEENRKIIQSELFQTASKHGVYQNVFYYQTTGFENACVFNLVFYEGFNIITSIQNLA
jgi:hypothetical protein